MNGLKNCLNYLQTFKKLFKLFEWFKKLFKLFEWFEKLFKQLSKPLKNVLKPDLLAATHLLAAAAHLPNFIC